MTINNKKDSNQIMLSPKKTIVSTLFFIFITYNLFSQQADTITVVENKDTIVNNLGNDSSSVYVRDFNYRIVNDTSEYLKSPKRAALYSMILPGLGQAYNRKYWKIPIIYGTLGGLVFLADNHNKEYRRYELAYSYMTDDKSETIDEFKGLRNIEDISFYQKRFRRNRDLAIIMTVVAYALNIVDASVDAHFSDFDINDDFSVNISPTIIPAEINSSFGLTFSINFK